jgi:hypothetical protein
MPGNTAEHVTVTLAGKTCALRSADIGSYQGKGLCEWDGVQCSGLGVSADGTMARCLSNAHTYTWGGAGSLHAPGKGTAVQPASIGYDYIDLWSSKTTWGGNDPPSAGDFAAISAGQIVVLDVSPPPLALITIQGKLVFADTKDLALNASYIIINKGTLEAGTAWKPHQHKLTITLTGNRLSPEVPTFGAKCLGVRQGTLQLHGKPKHTWTRLSRSALANETHLELRDEVNWERDDLIVLTSTSFDQEEAEPLRVEAVVNGTKEGWGRTVLLQKPLKYDHMGDGWHPGGPTGGLHRGWAHNGDNIEEYSAEVGLLSHNVIVQGDNPTSRREQFGVQIVWHSRGDNTAVGRCGPETRGPRGTSGSCACAA